MSKHLKISPKTFKYGRDFRQKLKFDKNESYVFTNFFEYGFKAIESGKLRKEHLESLNRTFKKVFNKDVDIKMNLSLIFPVTKKPLEMRMGCGKGQRQYWECIVKPGMLIFEIGNVNYKEVLEGFRIISNKMPFNIKLVKIYY